MIEKTMNRPRESMGRDRDPREREASVKEKEQGAIVLDFLPHGYPTQKGRRNPVVQAVGKEHFVLLELAPKKDIFLQPYEDVYIGEGKREKIHHIMGRLMLERLTPAARTELDYIVQEQVNKNEKRFVEFFNTAQPRGLRMHALELIPGIGKQHMWEIIEERQKKPFTSFADLRDRVRLMPDPEKAIVRRILNEIQGKEKHRLFVDV